MSNNIALREKGSQELDGENPTFKNNPEKFFNEGMSLLRENKIRESMLAFKKAFRIKSTVPRYSSYYGLSWAMVMNNAQEALVLCKKALEKEMFCPELFCNLGKVLLLRGNRKKAYTTFKNGLYLDSKNKEILNELKKMGVRKTPIIPFLARENIINKLIGKTLKKVGLR